MSDDPAYCSTCYGAAKKHGREVRMTAVYEYPVCTLCESRLRNGLRPYHPSNGTEFGMFEGRCEQCRHFDEIVDLGDAKQKACGWGILDKLLNGQFSESDSPNFWFDPAEIDVTTCPATCLRFTRRDDPEGQWRDPPPPDVPGQLTFDDIGVPVERAARERETVK